MASLVPRPLPDFILQPGEPIFLEGGDIKSGSGLGTRLATNYAPYEEVMKTNTRPLLGNKPSWKTQKKKVEKCQAIV